MMKRERRFLSLFIPIALLLTASPVDGQAIENRFQTRSSLEFSKEIFRNLGFELTPELRWDEGFKIDRFLLNSELQYKIFDFWSVSAGYRFIGNSNAENRTEFLHRYQFKMVFKTDIKRWEPGFGLYYTNFSDDNDGSAFLRYKSFLSRDIRKCKFTPKAGFEIFHQLDARSIYKLRYSVDLEYRLTKTVDLGAGYKLDYYMTRYQNRHIFDLGLKVKF